MNHKFQFNFSNLEAQYLAALELGYEFMTCAEYINRKDNLPPLTIVNRVDIDHSVKKAGKLRCIFDRIGIKATFFVRLHASEYNPFSFENYRIIKCIRDSGHEIGYHSEIIDQATIWDEDAAECLNRDIDIINRIFSIKIKGIASHGGMTGLNNLDFWNQNNVEDYNFVYEAYEKKGKFNLFYNSFYVSDSEWIRWKSYDKGSLCSNDNRSFGEHILDKHKLIYLLVHPDGYFERHFYE